MDRESPVEVLDLPHISTSPTYAQLRAALDRLGVPPSSWQSRVASGPVTSIYQKGIGRYLASIVASDLAWLSDAEREAITDQACARLSERCGPQAFRARDRDFKLPPTQSSPELTITIHEPSLTEDNLGLKTWAAAYVLAKRLPQIANSQDLISLLQRPESFRGVLELGSGTGLLGIAAAAVLHCPVMLTDLPAIVTNLEYNLRQNEFMVANNGGSLTADCLDWKAYESANTCLPQAAIGSDLGGFTASSFQVIIAADPLYSPEHSFLVSQVVAYLLTQNRQSRFILELPLRDDATQKMRDNLQKQLELANLELLESGSEDGFDDWEDAFGEPAVVKCWWGVWGRK